MEQSQIADLKRLPIAEFLSRLGHEPVKRSRNELWYRAPYRDERTPSFRVNIGKGVWYDFGLGKGGDIFTLAGEFIRSNDFMVQARFIAETAHIPLDENRKQDKARADMYRPKASEPAFEEVTVTPLRYTALTGYLSERSIPRDIALRHCLQVDYTVHRKPYFAVGFPNMAGGYELRSRVFKGCIPPKDVSLVKTGDVPAEGCNVFEGFMDFLSAVALRITDGGDSLVLNSVANIARSYRHLDNYGRIACYLDRDEAGRRALETLRTRYGGRITDRSGIYQGCKDLNEYLGQLSRKQQKNNNLKIK